MGEWEKEAAQSSFLFSRSPILIPLGGINMFVAISRFTIANDMTEPVKEAFLNRPHMVDDAPGFLRMDVIIPRDNPDQVWLLTYWADEDSYQTWHSSHAYRESHQGIPKGLKLVPQSTEIRFFDYICS